MICAVSTLSACASGPNIESSTDHFAALISRSRKPIAIDRIADPILFEPQIMDNESGSDVPVPLSSLHMITDIIREYTPSPSKRHEFKEDKDRAFEIDEHKESEITVDDEDTTNTKEEETESEIQIVAVNNKNLETNEMIKSNVMEETEEEESNVMEKQSETLDDLWSAMNLHQSADCYDRERDVVIDFLFEFKADSQNTPDNPCKQRRRGYKQIRARNTRMTGDQESAFILKVICAAVALLSGFLYIVLNDIGIPQMVPHKTTILEGYYVIDYPAYAQGRTPKPPQVIPF